MTNVRSVNRPKIAILGAGLLGRMLSVTLHQQYQISLFDKDNGKAEQSAAFLAAAMLAPLAESADAEVEVMQMGELALELWPEFIDLLDEPVFFQREGSLIVAYEQDMAAMKQFQSRLKAEGYETIDSGRIAEIEPGLEQRFAKGLFLPEEGQLDNRQLLMAMASQLENSTVDWQTHSNIAFDGDQLKINGELHDDFDWIIDCRGIGAQQDMNLQQAELRGVRGEVLRLRAPDVNLSRPVRLMHPRYPIYIAPKEDNLFVVGATQIESEDTREPTVRSALELLSACFSVDRGFAEAEILAIDSGLRPAYIDNNPHVYVDNKVISANGLYRHGYLLAPVMVKAIVGWLDGSIVVDSVDDKNTALIASLIQQKNVYAS